MNRPLRTTNQRGSVMLEFALSVITLTFLFTGTFQYGYSFYVYNNISTSVRSAARFASIYPYPSGNFMTFTKNIAVYGKALPAAGDPPVAPGLQTANIIVEIPPSAKLGAPPYVRVYVSGYRLNSIFGVWNLTGKPTATFTYTGHYQP